MPLFDTTFLIDLTAGDKGAVAMAQQVDRESDTKAISVITVHEYLRGVFYHYSGKKQFKPMLRKALMDLSYFEQVDYTSEIARQAAKIDGKLYRMGTIIPYADVVIAATAIHLGLPLITRDTHFKKVDDLAVVDY